MSNRVVIHAGNMWYYTNVYENNVRMECKILCVDRNWGDCKVTRLSSVSLGKESRTYGD